MNDVMMYSIIRFVALVTAVINAYRFAKNNDLCMTIFWAALLLSTIITTS